MGVIYGLAMGIGVSSYGGHAGVCRREPSGLDGNQR